MSENGGKSSEKDPVRESERGAESLSSDMCRGPAPCHPLAKALGVEGWESPRPSRGLKRGAMKMESGCC